MVAPLQPVVLNTDLAGRMGVTVSDLREPLVLFRYQVIRQAEFDAAQAQGKLPEGLYDGVQVWIELVKSIPAGALRYQPRCWRFHARQNN